MWDFGDKLFAAILIGGVSLGLAGWMVRPLDLPVDVYTDASAWGHLQDLTLRSYTRMGRPWMLYEEDFPVYSNPKRFKYTPKMICWPDDPQHCYWDQPVIEFQ